MGSNERSSPAGDHGCTGTTVETMRVGPKARPFLFLERRLASKAPHRMMEGFGKRLAAGFLKLLAGFAIALLLLTQFLDHPDEVEDNGPHIETDQQNS